MKRILLVVLIVSMLLTGCMTIEGVVIDVPDDSEDPFDIPDEQKRKIIIWTAVIVAVTVGLSMLTRFGIRQIESEY